MKKKISAVLLGLALLLVFQSASDFASSSQTSQMDGFIDDVLGSKYLYGGNTAKGFDCSGFTTYIFKKMGVDLPRRSSDQAKVGTKVAKANLIPGDLVFFDTDSKINGTITHVGIYVGDGNFAHASTRLGIVIEKLDSNYYKPRFVTARRILSEKQFEKFAVAPEEKKQ